jgi:ceramide glucosyltransferase
VILAALLSIAAYQVLALIASLLHLRRRDKLSSTRLPVSILKPIYGADEHFYSAIRSHALIDYPQFEILFGVRDSNDSSLPFIQSLQAEFPHVSIRLVQCSTWAPNGKVGSLIDLVSEARYSICVVNDSDIVVERDYLDKVAAPLEKESVGLVTCLYRAGADSFPSKWEALGIATEFAPSALVAPLVGVKEFGLGSTLAFRKADLEKVGGFEAIAEYIADDYQLGKRISQAGKQVHLLRMAVTTHLGAGTWKSVWEHQVRWARTIRLSRGAYYGLPIANASLWATAAAFIGWWDIVATLLGLRLLVGLVSGVLLLRDHVTMRFWWLMPARDLWGFAVWVAGALDIPVMWRGKRLRLDKSGRIIL